MIPAERREITELAAMYELEPSLRDVYVEGPLDRSLVEWFLSEAHASSATVREIDSINVPAALVEKAGFENNNRGRVLALAKAIEDQLGPQSLPVTCVIDADFDYVLGTNHALTILLSTDYSSMELYFFDAAPLQKFLQLVIRGFPKSAQTLLTEVTDALSQLFAIRFASHVLHWNMPLVAFERCLSMAAQGVQLDVPEFIDRCLNSAGRFCEKAEFERVLNELRLSLTGDVRKRVNGHDFLNVLAWYVRHHKGQSVPKGFDRSLVACVDFSTLRSNPLFEKLLERVSSR
jgi:hypothetical protein